MTQCRLKHYCDILESRKLVNQWEKVVLITKRAGITIQVQEQILENTAGYEAPYHAVKCKKSERLLGRQVSNKQNDAPVKNRIKLANGIYKQLSKAIFENHSYNTDTKLLLWNAIIRAILTYGLNVIKLTTAEENMINELTIKHMTKIFFPPTPPKTRWWSQKKEQKKIEKIQSKNKRRIQIFTRRTQGRMLTETHGMMHAKYYVNI